MTYQRSGLLDRTFFHFREGMGRLSDIQEECMNNSRYIIVSIISSCCRQQKRG